MKPNEDYPLHDLWKHLQCSEVNYALEPKSFPQDREYLRERARGIVSKALEETLNAATDKLLDRIVKVATRMDSKQREAYLLRVTAGIPKELKNWVCDMMHIEITKVSRDLVCFEQVIRKGSK